MPAIADARYVHTNLIARDWEKLARFYEQVFGCTRVPPARDLRGEWLTRGTGVPDAHLRGAHLRLPGHGPEGPTLEIFEYAAPAPAAVPVANQPGYGHLAFAVADVPSAVAAVVAGGGSSLGEIVEREVPGAGTVCFVYVRDPEGNIIELQRWS